MIIAQIEHVAPDFLSQAMTLVVALLVGAAATVSIIVGSRRLKRNVDAPQPVGPQPFEVKAATEFVRKEDVRASRAEIDRRLAEHAETIRTIEHEWREDRKDIEIAAKERTSGLYAKIDDVRKELTENQEQLRSEMTRNFADIQRALGRIEHRP